MSREIVSAEDVSPPNRIGHVLDHNGDGKVSLVEGIVHVLNTIKFLVLVACVELLLMAAIIMPIEGWSWHDAWWWSVVTGYTVGYGDISPVTTGGRFVATLHMILFINVLGSFIIALIIDAAKRDKDKFSHEEQEDLLDDTNRTDKNVLRIMEHLGLEPTDDAR